jgi:hypothetical protein
MKISSNLFISIAAFTLLSSTSVMAFTGPNTTTSTTATTPATTALSSTASPIAQYEVNTEEAFSTSTFPIKPKDLILRAKEVLSDDIKIGTKDNGKCLSDNFTFRAQFVEVDKEGYLNALKSFNLEDSWDIEQNYFGFTVDPMQTNRVWFFSRQIAKQISAFGGVEVADAASANAENGNGNGNSNENVLTLPPQTFHIDFDEDGKMTEFGFYTVDRNQGNTGGLGGAFAFFYGVGKPLPFPEGKPYKPSLRYGLLQKFGRFMSRFQK